MKTSEPLLAKSNLNYLARSEASAPRPARTGIWEPRDSIRVFSGNPQLRHPLVQSVRINSASVCAYPVIADGRKAHTQDELLTDHGQCTLHLLINGLESPHYQLIFRATNAGQNVTLVTENPEDTGCERNAWTVLLALLDDYRDLDAEASLRDLLVPLLAESGLYKFAVEAFHLAINSDALGNLKAIAADAEDLTTTVRNQAFIAATYGDLAVKVLEGQDITTAKHALSSGLKALEKLKDLEISSRLQSVAGQARAIADALPASTSAKEYAEALETSVAGVKGKLNDALSLTWING